MSQTRKVSLCDGVNPEIPIDGVRVPPALARWTGALLSRATLKLRARFEEEMAALDLRAKHFGVLALLQDGPRSQVEIGRDLMVDRTTMVALVDDLVRLGHVERGPHPEDRRAHAVTLTASGVKIFPKVLAIANALEDECLSALCEDERLTLRELLTRLL